MQDATKKAYNRPTFKDCGRISQQTLQSITGSPEATDPVQRTLGSPI